jgi:hypothetical protein
MLKNTENATLEDTNSAGEKYAKQQHIFLLFNVNTREKDGLNQLEGPLLFYITPTVKFTKKIQDLSLNSHLL